MTPEELRRDEAARWSKSSLLLLLADLRQALRQVLLVFFQQRRVARAAVDLARFVLAFVEFLSRPFIVDVRFIRPIHHLLRELRRYEVDSDRKSTRLNSSHANISY